MTQGPLTPGCSLVTRHASSEHPWDELRNCAGGNGRSLPNADSRVGRARSKPGVHGAHLKAALTPKEEATHTNPGLWEFMRAPRTRPKGPQDGPRRARVGTGGPGESPGVPRMGRYSSPKKNVAVLDPRRSPRGARGGLKGAQGGPKGGQGKLRGGAETPTTN